MPEAKVLKIDPMRFIGFGAYVIPVILIISGWFFDFTPAINILKFYVFLYFPFVCLLVVLALGASLTRDEYHTALRAQRALNADTEFFLSLVLAMLMAAAGWIFTAVVYFISVVLHLSTLSFVQDRLAIKQAQEEKAP